MDAHLWKVSAMSPQTEFVRVSPTRGSPLLQLLGVAKVPCLGIFAYGGLEECVFGDFTKHFPRFDTDSGEAGVKKWLSAVGAIPPLHMLPRMDGRTPGAEESDSDDDDYSVNGSGGGGNPADSDKAAFGDFCCGHPGCAKTVAHSHTVRDEAATHFLQTQAELPGVHQNNDID